MSSATHRWVVRAVALGACALAACGGGRELPSSSDLPLQAWIEDEQWVGWLQLRVSPEGVDPYLDLRPTRTSGTISPAQSLQVGTFFPRSVTVDHTGARIEDAGEVGGGTWVRTVRGLQEQSPVQVTEVSVRVDSLSHAVDGHFQLEEASGSHTVWLEGSPTFVCPRGNRHSWTSPEDPDVTFEFECDGE